MKISTLLLWTLSFLTGLVAIATPFASIYAYNHDLLGGNADTTGGKIFIHAIATVFAVILLIIGSCTLAENAKQSSVSIQNQLSFALHDFKKELQQTINQTLSKEKIDYKRIHRIAKEECKLLYDRLTQNHTKEQEPEIDLLEKIKENSGS